MKRIRVRATWGKVVDAVVILALAGVVALPVAARLSAPKPIPPLTPAARLPALQRSPAPPIRDVPVFAHGGAAEDAVEQGAVLTDPAAMLDALDRAAAAALPEGTGADLLRIAKQGPALFDVVAYRPVPYPFRYPRLEAVLGGVPAGLSEQQATALGDLGALLIVAGARFPQEFPLAGPVAFAVLDRAGGACDPQLNLAFLLSTDKESRDDDTAREFAMAERACPGDPTPLYLLGQFQGLRTVVDGIVGESTPFEERIRRAIRTFRRLEQMDPGSPAGWSGEADTWLRLGLVVQAKKPFTARVRFRRALALYRRSEALDPGSTAAAGTARALDGLGLGAQAVAAQERVLRTAPDSTLLQNGLVGIMERAHMFGRAADRAGDLPDSVSVPSGSALFPGLVGFRGPIDDAGAGRPVSIGVDRWDPVSFSLEPISQAIGGGGLENFSFIPEFRSIPPTQIDPSCREWSRLRDLLLAGRPREAVEQMPPAFFDLRGHRVFCGDDELRPVALLEAGRIDDARTLISRYVRQGLDSLARYRGSADPGIAFLQDLRQNVWRFAGDLPRAAAVAKEWAEADPGLALPDDRAGEIAFLQGDFAAAAVWFGREAAHPGRPLDRATALLKGGTALEKARRFDEALRLFADADAIAVRIARLRPASAAEPEFISYNARVQAGDTELRAQRFREAVGHYEAARRHEAQLRVYGAGDVPLFRPEVLENNEALVLAHLGEEDRAVAAIDAAVASDPANPVFLENQGLVRYRLGRPEEAEAAYRSTLAADPSVFPAANDLGVILAEDGRFDEAVVALRRAVGAEPGYAQGWFNLGVVLSRMGGSHFLQAQGAFARASSLDSAFREHERELIFDDDLFFTTLDLSKPVPPNWRFAGSTDRTPVAVAGLVLLLLLLAFRVGHALFREYVAGRVHDEALERGGRWRRLSVLGRGITPVVALVATVAVVVWPLVREDGVPIQEELTLAAGTLVLAGVYLRVRAGAARRRGVGVRHYTWTPSVLIGVGATALGFGFAPLPAAEQDQTALPARALAVGALGALTVVLLGLGLVTGVPLARALGATALLMTSSVLAPVEPLDGAFVARGRAGLLVGVGLMALALLLALGVL